MLERTREDWSENTVSPGFAPLAGRFLLKLYGSLASPSSALLSQAEFQAALDRPNLDALRQILAGCPFVFVGCSLEGLLADLSALAMPENCPQLRYAIAGVSGNWERIAESLLRRFQITVLPCAEDHISETLPEFLQALVQSVEEARCGAAPLAAISR